MCTGERGGGGPLKKLDLSVLFITLKKIVYTYGQSGKVASLPQLCLVEFEGMVK